MTDQYTAQTCERCTISLVNLAYNSKIIVTLTF